MTLIAVWWERFDDRVWIVSDNRLSNPGTIGTRVLTDHAAKILAAPIVLLREDPKLFAHIPIRVTSLGFAYTGSFLVAMQAYAAVIPLWSRLQATGQEVFPTVRDFANHLQKFVSVYARDVGANDPAVACQCVLVGWDETSNKASAFVIEAARALTGISNLCREIPLYDANHVEFLGSGAAEAREKFSRATPQDFHGVTARRPLRFMRNFIPATEREDVGGGIQVGYASRLGFQLVFDLQPINLGYPDAVARYRGFEYGEIAQVGQAFSNLMGIA